MTFLKVLIMLAIFGMASAYNNPYQYSCPDVEKISKAITEYFVRKNPTFAPGLLRMVFHDCAVRGCDASVLLDPTPSNNATEKIAVPNLTLNGYEVVNAVKAELERRCPGVVSCADVLALTSRDAIVAINGPWWYVPLGRKDGRISLASEAVKFLPSPRANISTLKKNFADIGLSLKDLVVLSGGHTIGIGHCNIIQNRLYNFTGKGDTDPKIEASYAKILKYKCPKRVGDLTTVAAMDAISSKVFDKEYFTTVSQRRGFFESDAALLDDYYTKSYLQSQANSNGATFANDFAASMTKLIQLGFGSQGEVRKTCGAVKSYY
ncbi:hypothetical protein RND81_14G012400 [Saponaria officinalis]|uniref:Peroxidase n=1 Tax=Saponaria officinalis TaxID=3572 RepID=A0AAW1GSW5_SAPOF